MLLCEGVFEEVGVIKDIELNYRFEVDLKRSWMNNSGLEMSETGVNEVSTQYWLMLVLKPTYFINFLLRHVAQHTCFFVLRTNMPYIQNFFPRNL